MEQTYLPYTYLIGWSRLNKWYYGVETGNKKKTANPSNLWNTYFTSSECVTKFRELNGEPDIIEIRKTFIMPEKALEWEDKVIRRMKMVYSEKFLNLGTAGKSFNTLNRVPWNKGKPWSEEIKKKISLALKGKPILEKTKRKISKTLMNRQFTDEHRKRISESHKGKKKRFPEKCATYGMLGKKHSKESIEKRTASRKRNRMLKMLSTNTSSNI